MIKCEINISGAIFCQIIKIKLFIHESPSITLGNQKWNGAAPLFIKREDKIIMLGILETLIVLIWYGILILIIINKMAENKRTEEARACVRKYFIEASVDIKFEWIVIRGINASKLISRPIHALSHEFDEIEIIVPIIKIIRKRIFEGFFKIKKKRIITFINGVWAQ